MVPLSWNILSNTPSMHNKKNTDRKGTQFEVVIFKRNSLSNKAKLINNSLILTQRWRSPKHICSCYIKRCKHDIWEISWSSKEKIYWLWHSQAVNYWEKLWKLFRSLRNQLIYISFTYSWYKNTVGKILSLYIICHSSNKSRNLSR